MSASFHSLTVSEVRRETDDAVSVRLDLPEALSERFRFRPGQHLTLRREIAGEDIRRNYSVCAAPHEGELRIAIKRVEDGRFSTWANAALAPGTVLDVMPPHGSFTWLFDPARTRHYAGFAGGSGITPILSLIKAALHEEPASRFTLFYGNRTSDGILFLEELAALKNRFLDRLQVFHFLSGEEEEAAIFNGRLDTAKLPEILGTLIDPAAIDAAFVCGPGAMMDAVEASLLAAGVDSDRILVERFTVDRPSAAQAQADRAIEQRAMGARMTLTLDGRRRTLRFDAQAGNILDSARASGLPAPYACKAGVCATCRARVRSGEVYMKANYGLSPKEVADGYVLTCQAVPVSSEVELDFDG